MYYIDIFYQYNKMANKTKSRSGKKTRNTRLNNKMRKTSKPRVQCGGIGFNVPLNFSVIPPSDFYDKNSYMNDPSVAPYTASSRTMLGGRKEKSHNLMKAKSRRRVKKMHGGWSFYSSDPLLGTNLNTMSGFGTTAGSQVFYNTVNGTVQNNDGAIFQASPLPATAMV